MKYVCFYAILFCMLACQHTHHSELPKLDFPMIETNPEILRLHQRNSQRDVSNTSIWKESIQLSKRFSDHSKEQIWKSIQQFQTLLATASTQQASIVQEKYPPFFANMLQEQNLEGRDSEIIQAIPYILYAIENKTFQGWELPNKQIPEFQATWQELCEAERNLLYAGIIIAELRQKAVQSNIPLADSELFLSLNELSTQTWIESRRALCNVLFSGYQQLMIQNPNLHLPE